MCGMRRGLCERRAPTSTLVSLAEPDHDPTMSVLDELDVREKLLICQSVHGIGAGKWDKVAAQLDNHPLWTKDRKHGYFTAQVGCSLVLLHKAVRVDWLAALRGHLHRAHEGRRQRHVRAQ